MVKLLDAPVRTPLGLGALGGPGAEPATGQSRPGDRVLFHSDGVIEARSPDGDLFGLVELTERHEAAGLPAPETLRRIVHAVLDHQRGRR